MDLRFIQKELQHMPCPKHGKSPDISILGDRLHIRCCDEFRGEVMRKYNSLKYKAINEDMRREIKRILR